MNKSEVMEEMLADAFADMKTGRLLLYQQQFFLQTAIKNDIRRFRRMPSVFECCYAERNYFFSASWFFKNSYIVFGFNVVNFPNVNFVRHFYFAYPVLVQNSFSYRCSGFCLKC